MNNLAITCHNRNEKSIAKVYYLIDKFCKIFEDMLFHKDALQRMNIEFLKKLEKANIPDMR